MEFEPVEHLAATHKRFDIEQAATMLTGARPAATISYRPERQDAADAFVAASRLYGIHIKRMKSLYLCHDPVRAEGARNLANEADHLSREDLDRRVGRLLDFPEPDVEWFASTKFPPDGGAWIRMEIRAIDMLQRAAISPTEYESLELLPYIPQPNERGIFRGVERSMKYARALNDVDFLRFG